MAIQNGDLVQVHYKGSLEDGTVFDSSEGRDPLSFTAGSNELIPGFSQGVLGMEKGDTKTLTLEPENAYGERRDELLQQVPREQLPEDIEVGSVLVPSNDPNMRLFVTAMTDEHAMVDGNHPLAGKKLIFDIEVVEVTSSLA